MTTLTLEIPSVENRLQQGRRERGLLSRRATEDAAGGGRSAVGGGGEATLADVIASAWEDLTAVRAVDCPLCHGELAPQVTTLAGEVIAARCSDCGTTLD